MDMHDASPTTRAARARRPLGLAAALLALVAVVGWRTAPTTANAPADDERVAALEADFLMGMITHHRGAIAMAEMALDKSSRPELRDLAQRIIDDQSREIALMTGYLRDWYGLTPPEGDVMPEDIMMGMEMPMLRGMMPDMQAEMENLAAKSGDAFDSAFMSALTDHHAMAIMMASPVLIAAEHPELYQVATNIVIAQGEEIRTLQRWLADWFGIEHP